jgi:hypothetical protein
MAYANGMKTNFTGFTLTERAYALALPSISLAAGALGAYQWWNAGAAASWWSMALLAPPVLVSGLVVYFYQTCVPHRRE